MQGTLHTYHPTRSLLLFEHLNTNPAAASASPSATSQQLAPRNTLIFVGGMFDNFLTPPYTCDLASLYRDSSRWRVCHVQLSSAMRGFGISSLAKDVQELCVAVKFVRETLCAGGGTGSRAAAGGGILNGTAATGAAAAAAAAAGGGGKVVLMGHSTGCQDLLSYLYLETKTTGPLHDRPRIDGVILQAPVSDREGAMPGPDASPEHTARWAKCLRFADRTEESERRTTLLPMHATIPLFGPVPLSVERFLSLASPGSPERPGEDDLFSSDAAEGRLRETFGVVGKGDGVLRRMGRGQEEREMLVLVSGADEHVPGHVDKAALLGRWKAAVEEGAGRLHRASQVVVDGLHDLGGDDVKRRHARMVAMRAAVMAYLDDVLGEEGPESVVEQVWRRERDGIIEGERRRLSGEARI